MRSRFTQYFLAGVLSIAFIPSVWAGHNILNNPSFEAPIGGGGNWDDTNGAVRVDAGSLPLGFSAIPDGAFALALEAGTFTFQVSALIEPGYQVTFTGRAESNIPTGFGGGALKIEFQDAGNNLLQATSSVTIDNASAPQGGGYQTFTVTATAPANTAQVVFVMDAPDFTGPPPGTRFVIYDDMFTEILAPAGVPGGMPVAAANILGNPSIEFDIGPSIGNWDSTNGAIRANAATLAASGFASAPNGNFAMIVPEGAFTFQLVPNVHEGDLVTFSGFAQSTILGLGSGGRLKIEFKKIEGEVDILLDASNVSDVMNFATAPGHATNNYVYFEAQGVAPAGTNSVVFVIETLGGLGGGAVAVDNLHATVNPVGFSLGVSPSTAAPGEAVTVFAQFQNTSSITLNDVEFVAQFPSGFNVLKNTIRKNGETTSFEEGSIIVPVGTLVGSQTVAVSFVTLITSGVTVGKTYNLTVLLRNADGLAVSRKIQVTIQPDPLFDHGTIIGKVFHDENQNGVQDDGELGVPWVKLVTEEGIMVVTDEHGRYSIPAVKPGRHLIKIDGHSLPQGTKFITSENVLVRTTPGILNKANFAVLLPPSDIPQEFQGTLSVTFSQGLDTSRPQLGVQMRPEVLKAGSGVLEQDAVFRFNINYPDFVKHWYLEIRDEAGENIWSGFGVSAPPAEVTWSGQAANGLLIKPGLYSYQFKVEDARGRQDWTPLHFFRVVSKADPDSAKTKVEIPPVGNFNIFKDGKSSIPMIAKPTVRIQGKTKPDYKVRINSREIPVHYETGRFYTEFYVNPGEKEFIVQAVSPEGQITSYRKVVEVKDSTFFLVALGEQELGYNFGRGNFETAGNDGRHQDGFYEDGRLSYFLKGKLKGKFLVKSHYDTDDKRTALFRNLDPDKYYPVYGDDSKIDYEAINTRQRFYILVEMDRSFLRWGSFETAFTDTEIASYNRTLSGLQGHYESLDTTSYGDPKRSVKLFWSNARHRSDHNEFGATGGSLYYLRNRNVIEGSEKLRIDIRDKIQGMTLKSYDLAAGVDYKIDYDEGRVLLSRPLSSVAASDTLTAFDILDGSPVFLVVDYEYDAGFDALEHSNRGLRGYTHFGNHIRIGGTAIKENRHGAVGTDYDLRGVDMQVKVGRNTKITAEYAESKQQQVTQSVSFDGGMTFVDPGLIRGQNTRPRENAYLIKGETKPVKNLEVSGFLQGVEPSFSTHQIRFHEGTKKYGLSTRYKLTDSFSARYRFDSSEAVGQLMPLANHGVAGPYETRRSHIAQLGYDDGKWLGEIEYMRQLLNLPPEDFLFPTVLSEFPFENAIALKLGYRIDERLLPYAKFQTSFKDGNYYQLGGGLRYQVLNDVFAYIEQMTGNMGDSTLFGLERQHDQRSRSYANIRMRDQRVGTKSLSTTIGNSFGLTEKSRIFSEREHTTYDSVNGYADILGYEGKAGDHWDYELRFERRHLDSSKAGLLNEVAEFGASRNNTFNTASGALAYALGDKFRARVFLEGRRDSDTPSLWQWVTRNSVEYRINEDLRYVGRLDFGKTRFTDPEGNPADFMEFNTGFAYRPVFHDKFNMLTRYSYLRNAAHDTHFRQVIGIDQRETAHIIAVDLAYDLHKYLTLVEKLAYKNTILNTSVTDEIILHHLLWVNRFNFHVTRKWDVALEYRMLWQFDALKTLRHGALVEVDREFYDYVRLGVGYNFTDFDDNLNSSSNYESHGPFVRLTGKF